MNRFDNPFGKDGEAELVYGDGEFQVVRQGAYVLCAVTGVRIPLDELRYWSVEYQEPYATPDASLQRYLDRRSRA